MGLSMRVRATALASLVALGSVANAQGFYYQDIRSQCDISYNYQYLGCAATNSAPFAFAPTNWDPASTADNSRSYINYDTGDFVNMTVTPYFCSQFCRAHGFKYAALWDKSCRCGNSLDYRTIDGTDVNLSNLIDASSETKCTTGRDGNPYPPCGGDRRENCGSNGGARIFVDPSYPDERSLTDFATIAQGYGLLGCFQNGRFPSAEHTVTTVSTTSTDTCFQYCADLGMPYVYMSRGSPDNQIECNCGSEFNKNVAQAGPDATGCTRQCSDPTQTTGCTGQDCCGSGNGPFPVYSNPKLMGCFIPLIPGVANPPSDTPASDGYDCFATPASILNRAPSPVVAYASRTMSASASFIATASPAANAFVNYGCWQNTQVANLFETVNAADIPAGSISVDSCVSYCDTNNHRFAAIYGLAPNSNCACGDTLKPDVTPNGAMEDCNQPCPGSAQQNCGGDNGPLVYARSDVTPNQWAQSYTATWSQTIRYSCQGGNGGGGSTSTTSSTSTTDTTTTTTDTTTTTTDTTTTSTDTTTTSTDTTTTSTDTTTTTTDTTTTTTDTTTTSTSTSTSTSTTTATTTDTTTVTTTSTASGTLTTSTFTVTITDGSTTSTVTSTVTISVPGSSSTATSTSTVTVSVPGGSTTSTATSTSTVTVSVPGSSTISTSTFTVTVTNGGTTSLSTSTVTFTVPGNSSSIPTSTVTVSVPGSSGSGAAHPTGWGGNYTVVPMGTGTGMTRPSNSHTYPRPHGTGAAPHPHDGGAGHGNVLPYYPVWNPYRAGGAGAGGDTLTRTRTAETGKHGPTGTPGKVETPDINGAGERYGEEYEYDEEWCFEVGQAPDDNPCDFIPGHDEL